MNFINELCHRRSRSIFCIRASWRGRWTIRVRHNSDLPAGLQFGAAVAIDTETLGLDVRRDRLCVVQLSSGDGSAEIVQIAPGQARAPNLEKFAGPSRRSSRSFILAASIWRFCAMPSASCPRRSIAPRSPQSSRATYTDRHGLKDLHAKRTHRRRSFQTAAILRLGSACFERGATGLCRLGRPASARLARQA